MTPLRDLFFDGHKPVGLRELKRSQHYVVDQRENRRGRADTKRERQHADDTEPRRPDELSQRVTSILQKTFERRHPPCLVRLFPDQCRIAKRASSRTAGVFRRHTLFTLLLFFQFEIAP